MTFETFLASLTEEQRYAVEERAAIYEYDGGLPRAEAERLALHEWVKRIVLNQEIMQDDTDGGYYAETHTGNDVMTAFRVQRHAFGSTWDFIGPAHRTIEGAIRHARDVAPALCRVVRVTHEVCIAPEVYRQISVPDEAQKGGK